MIHPENSFFRHVMERIEHLQLKVFGFLINYVLYPFCYIFF